MNAAAGWICRRCLLRSSFPARSAAFVRRQTTSASPNSISSAVLKRARAVAAEHAQLSEKLVDSFDTRTAKKAGEAAPIVAALQEWEKANESLTELRSLVNDPTADAELRDLAADDLPDTAAQLERASQTLTGSLVPRHPFAHLPCMLEIRPGAGGSEAALFAADLLRMYQAYCARRGLRAHLVKYEDADGMGDPRGSDAPLQEAILEVDDDGAYARFRCEAGVHRVQRVPATESKGRTHTSSASVLVLPSFPEGAGANMDFEDPNSDYFIDPKEVRTDIMRASGAGGQHVNKTESAVRLTHIPTGTVAAIQDSRSQRANRDKAWQVLRSRIAQLRREAREEEALNLRRSVIGVAKMGREHKIRTYNWGQQRVTDHRSGLTIHGLDDVIEGGDNLEKAMESVRQWMSDQEVQQMVLLQESEEKK
ncbi:putative peptide chain release factor 1, mitochondrial [Diplodia seriata]|uniref:Putative peptide chain release factor 1, mitochondrial n=1 Tax=Diplodia seriata TaxID=420778 RepID=A0A1S8BBH3_9PEZI|nr:putative peptide chain release factor 1, mitochondrial [Diplodia seriata]